MADKTRVWMLLVAATGDCTPNSGIWSLLFGWYAGMAAVISGQDCILQVSANTVVTRQAQGAIVLRAAVREPTHLLPTFLLLLERLVRGCSAAVTLPHDNWYSISSSAQ